MPRFQSGFHCIGNSQHVLPGEKTAWLIRVYPSWNPGCSRMHVSCSHTWITGNITGTLCDIQPLKTWFLSVFYRFLFPIDFPFNPSNVMDSLMKPFSVLTFSRTRRQSMAMVDRRLVGERTEPHTWHVHCVGQLCFSDLFSFFSSKWGIHPYSSYPI